MTIVEQEVLDDLQRLARLMQSPGKVLEAVKLLASYDNSIDERTNRLAALDTQITAAGDRVLKAQADADAAIAAETARVEEERKRLNTRIVAATSEATIAEKRRAELQHEVAELETKADSIRAAIAGVRI